jgi:hypothetical protein
MQVEMPFIISLALILAMGLGGMMLVLTVLRVTTLAMYWLFAQPKATRQ